MQIIIERKTKSANKPAKPEFGEKIGLLGKLFGCRHRKLTKPLTVKNFSYCACLECGARQPFDAENLRTLGAFYYPPSEAFRQN